MKKLFSFCVALFATTALWADGFKSGNLYYSITSYVEPYTVEVTYEYDDQHNNMYANFTTVTIPKTVTIDGIVYSVTRIGHGAFEGCTSLTSITIPESVVSIGSDAFDNTALYSNQPDGVVYIGDILYAYKGTMPQGTSITILKRIQGALLIMSFALMMKILLYQILPLLLFLKV